MRTSRWSSLLGLLAASLLSPTTLGAQAPGDGEAAARRAFERGRDAYESGDFEAAVQSFDEAYRLSPRPALLFNIGRAAEATGRNEHAIAAYQAYLQQLPAAENRGFVEGRLAQLHKQRAAPPPPAAPPPAPSSPVESRAASAASVREPAPAPPEPASAAPSSTRGRLRAYLGLRTAVGGEIESTVDDEELMALLEADDATELGLRNMFGFQLGGSYVWPYFGLGGELRMSRIKTELIDPPEGFERFSDNDTDTLWDVVFKPLGRFELDSAPLELQLALPLGLTIPRISQVDEDAENLGFNLGILLGANYFFTSRFGLAAEMGWQMHWLPIDNVDPELEGFTLAYGQWTLLALSALFAP